MSRDLQRYLFRLKYDICKLIDIKCLLEKKSTIIQSQSSY